MHICAWFSKSRQEAGIYLNGTSIGSASFAFESVHGGGDLIIGQEQDDIDVGSLDPSQAYR